MQLPLTEWDARSMHLHYWYWYVALKWSGWSVCVAQAMDSMCAWSMADVPV